MASSVKYPELINVLFQLYFQITHGYVILPDYDYCPNRPDCFAEVPTGSDTGTLLLANNKHQIWLHPKLMIKNMLLVDTSFFVKKSYARG